MVASIIALKLAKPLSTPELFKDGDFWVSDMIKGVTDNKDRPVEVLLVDDCIRHEKTIMEPARLLLSSGRNVNVTKAVLMVAEEAVKYVDMYYKVLDNYPPIGEWNLLHWKRGKIAVDMDGVICEDCLHEIDMNEELYTEWLKNARPYLIPDYEIDYIVSCRLEKYRNATEEWLKKYGVKYNELILWDLPSKDKRDDLFASYKRDVLLKIKPTVYWESSYDQALEIWESTRIPTICVDKMISFGPIEE